MITAKDILDMSERVDLALTEIDAMETRDDNLSYDGWKLHDDVADGFVTNETWVKAFKYEPYWAELVYVIMFSDCMWTWPDESVDYIARRINTYGWKSFAELAEYYIRHPRGHCFDVCKAYITEDGDVIY